MTATATPSAAVTTRSRRFAPLRRLRPIHVVAAETVLAGILMSYELGRQSLWFDETVTADVVDRSIRSVAYAAVHGPMTGLYVIGVRLWVELFGDTEVALRSFSMILGVALVPAVYALTARLFGTRTALVAGLLTVLSATVIAQAQQARQYMLVMLVVTLATLCLVRAVEIGTRWSWLLYALVAALAVYAHVLVLFVVAGQALSLVALPKKQVPWRSMLIAAGVFVLIVIPFFAALLHEGSGGVDWIQPTTWTRVERTFETFAGGTVSLLLLALVPCGFALRAALRTGARFGRSTETWRYALLTAALFVPIVGVLLFSVVKPMFVDRYLLGALPAFVILIAVGITTIRPPLVGAALLVVFVVLGASVVVNWLGSDTRTAWTGVPREDWRGAVTYVLAHATAGDAVVLQPRFLESAWTYYYLRRGSPRGAPELASTGLVDDLADRREVRSIARRYGRVWLVMTHLDADERRGARAKFAAYYALTRTRRFTGRVDVFRFDA